MPAKLRELKKQERRTAILRASEELFRTRGIKTVSLEQVADSIGISRGTIYNHFLNKDLLLEAILSPFFQKMDEELSAAEHQEEFDLEDLAEFCYRVWVHHRRVWDIIHDPDLAEHRVLAEHHDGLHRRFLDLIGGVLSQSHPGVNVELGSRVILSVFLSLLSSLEGQEKQKALFITYLKALSGATPSEAKK